MKRIFLENDPGLNSFVRTGLRSLFQIEQPFEKFFDKIIYQAYTRIDEIIPLAREADEIWYSSEQHPDSETRSIFEALIPIAIREQWKNKMVINYTMLSILPLPKPIQLALDTLKEQQNIVLYYFHNMAIEERLRLIQAIHSNMAR